MEIKRIFENKKIKDFDLYNELLRVNKELISRWNIKVTLDKFFKLQDIDSVYNAYFFIENWKKIWFWLISNEDWEDKLCKDIKDKYQLDKDNVYWLANFFIYPEYRKKWYWNKCFNKILNLTKNKSFYLYTDKNNIPARKIYSKHMNEIWIYNNEKIIYLREDNEK